MHHLNWLGFTGCMFVLCVSIDAQDQQLTLTPSTVETGDHVKMHCVFHDTSPAFTVSIRDYETKQVIWQISSPSRSISVGDAFRWRVKHTDQLSYHSEVTITLTDVTRTDEGWYTCLLEKTNQPTLIGSGYLEVQVPPRSMRVFVTSPPPYIESQAYAVKCTFSVYPANSAVLGYYVAIIRRNERKEVAYSAVQNGSVYDVTSSATFGLSRQNNGERTLRCEVTWKNGTEREKTYTAMLETPLNVTFATADISMDVLPRTTYTAGETISAMCRAGSANPPHQIDWWIKKYINEGKETTYEAGEYNGQKTVSTLRVTAERVMDGEEVLCCLRDTPHCQRKRIVVTTTNDPTTTTVTSTETSSMSTTSSRPDSPSTSTTRKPTTLSTALYSTTSKTTTSTTRTATTVRTSDKSTEAEITTTGSYNPDEQTGMAQSLIIGLAVGVGAGVIIIIVIILAVVLLRRRKGKGTGGKGLQEADKDQGKRLSMNMYDEIDESKVGTNGTKTDRPGVVYEEIKNTSFKTTLLQQRPGYDKLNGEVKNPTSSEWTSNHLPLNDPPDTGELYAVVNKPPKPGVQEGRRQSNTSNASSEPDIGPAIQERRKSLEKNTTVADTKESEGLEEPLHGATQVEQGRNSVSKDNKKSEVAPVLKPVMKSKPSKPTKPEKPTVTPLKPKVDKANKPRQGLTTSDESQSVYYNTREEMIHEGTPKINPASDKRKDNKKNMKKPEDNRTEYYNTHDGVRKSTGSSNAGLDYPYCEIPTENTNNNVEDGAPEYAEIGNTQDKCPQRSTAPLDGSSYHTVDFSQEQDDSDDSGGGDSDSD